MTRIKSFLQSEASECGLACLAMISAAHGLHLELSELRQRFSTNLRGVDLPQLIQCAADLGYSARPLRLELQEIVDLQTPCILHWDMNHFVVLKKVGAKAIVILDPALGERRLSLAEASRHFTGVAVELTPNTQFRPAAPAPRLSLASLTGKITGLKRSLIQILGVAIALELFALLAPLLNQMIVDDALSSGDFELLNVLVIGFGLLLLTQTLIGLARSWMVLLLGQTLSLQWRGNLFAHLVKLPLGFFEKRHLGDISSRFGSVGAIQQTLTNSVIEAVLDGLMAVATLSMMLIYAPGLSAVVVTSVLLYGLLRWAAYGSLRETSGERLILAAKENTHFLETLRAMTPLKLFGREQERRARWQNQIVEVQNRDVSIGKLGLGISSAQGLIFGIENLLVMWLGARLIMGGQASGGAGMTVGMLFAFISYKSQFSSRVAKLIDHVINFKMLDMHCARLADIALEPPEVDTAPPSDLAHLRPVIELRNVSFRYGHGEPWVLKNASLKIEAGEHMAVTGPSGAGKTTLLKIALGLMPPTAGEVLYGGIAIKHLGLANYRRQIGTVMQEDALLSGSLADNISFFDVQPDQARVEACATQAQLHGDIVRMPMGYQTLVGDLGSGLSGGQKQRLLLARALYKQPRVLALDEATSHLDLHNERAVTAALSHLRLTRLIIAHRPETIAGAQRVVMVRDGQVTELLRAVKVPESETVAG
jgi:ATP-binding cassette subfamily B protein RaxB